MTQQLSRALAIAELGHTRLGDLVQAITDLRRLKEHLHIQELAINLIDPEEFRLAEAILTGDPLFRECTNLPYAQIRYQDYQRVLHYTVFKDCEITRALTRDGGGLGAGTSFNSLQAMRWDLRRLHGESWQDFAYPFPLLPVPADVLVGSRGNHRIYLREDEHAWAAEWLRQAGVASDDLLIVFVDDASASDKLLDRDCVRGVLEHFLSVDRVKILLYDLQEAGKQEAYREMLGAERFARLVFSTRNGLRRDLALLGAAQVRMILGPDTGMMHCAAGVHAVLAARNRARPPLLLVYAGQWLDFNMWDFWSGSVAQCLVAYEGESGPLLQPLYECPRPAEEFARGLVKVGELTADRVIECLEVRFEHELQALGLRTGWTDTVAQGWYQT
jgi:hypothetical protein